MQNSILILCMLSSTSYCFSETSFFLSFFFKANFAILLACLPIIFSIMMFLWSLVIILSFWRNTPSFYIFLSFSSGQTDQKSCPVHKHSSEEYEEDWPIIMSIQMSTLRPRVLRAQRVFAYARHSCFTSSSFTTLGASNSGLRRWKSRERMCEEENWLWS